MDGSIPTLLKQESRQSNAESPGRGAERLTRWLWLVAAVVAIAGLLFGYDQGVISGALRGIENTFHVGTTATEIITSWVTLGALAGALIGGGTADRIGRRPTLLLAGGLFFSLAPSSRRSHLMRRSS